MVGYFWLVTCTCLFWLITGIVIWVKYGGDIDGESNIILPISIWVILALMPSFFIPNRWEKTIVDNIKYHVVSTDNGRTIVYTDTINRIDKHKVYTIYEDVIKVDNNNVSFLHVKGYNMYGKSVADHINIKLSD